MDKVIYGCGSVGEGIFQECIKKNISIECFCDDEIGDNGRKLFGLEILTLKTIKNKYPDSEFFISIPTAHSIIDKLKRNGFNNWKLSCEILDNTDYIDFSYTENKKIAISEIKECLTLHKYYDDPSKLLIRSLDLVITEKCSLKCSQCSNLIEHYENPKDFSYDEVILSLNKLLNHVNGIFELRIIGGEPFMNREVYEIIEKLVDYNKIKRIIIFTNGTILPPKDKWKYLKNEKITFFITDYGKLSKNLDKIREKLEHENIPYKIIKTDQWSPCVIKKHQRSDVELKEVYFQCCAKNLTTLLNSKLFKCPFIANLANLNLVKIDEEDFIDLDSLKQKDKTDSKKTLYDFLFKKSLFQSCDYCLGRLYNGKKIKAAVQLK